MHGSITHIESSQIFDRILYRWAKLSQNGKAPNLLLDVARASKWAIGLAQTGGTQVEIHAATLDTEAALKRSYKRGQETGRFMPTKDLLEGHQQQLAIQIAAISESKDPANLFVYDTEVIFGNPPGLFLISNSANKTMSILNCKSLISYLQKRDININGCNSKNIYEVKVSIKDSLKMLIKGFDVSFYSNNGEERIFTIPKEGHSIMVDNENLFKTTYLKDKRFKEVVESAKSLGYSFGENLDKFLSDINQESIKVSSNTASYVLPKNQASNKGKLI